MITNLPTKPLSLEHIKEKDLVKLGNGILDLMNLSGVDIGRDTHYNTKEELEKARSDLHKKVFVIDRTVYACLFCLPGVNDFSRQKATGALLAQPRDEKVKTLFDNAKEREIIDYIIESISQPNRVINLFVGCTAFTKRNKDGDIIKSGLNINNARTRSIVFKYILNARNLELWTVKYRTKLKLILTHMWGTRTTGVLRKILVRKKSSELDAADKKGLQKYIASYVEGDAKRKRDVIQCIAFILGRRTYLTLPMLKTFQQAKKDITKGKTLPMEVLEGLATTFHPTATKADILKLTKRTMTTKQKKLVQKTAKKAGVKIEFDPTKYPMVDLYIYAFEMGWTPAIGKALKAKAQRAAEALPFKYGRVGILVDDSNSSGGSKEAKLKPLAVSLATRDMISYTGTTSYVEYTSRRHSDIGTIIKPMGDTCLADAFLSLIEQEVDAVFIISDGYENAPAGRFSEVLSLVRGIGCPTSIYHINPVAAAESGHGVRILDSSIPVMPISQPEQMALSLFKAMLQTDPKRGVIGLINAVLPAIDRSKQLKGGDRK
jgi:hypothetical protein